ncbi:MAG: BLUF domain-containing protein [Henriciella sp.]
MLESGSVFDRAVSVSSPSDSEGGTGLWAISYHSRQTDPLTQNALQRLLLQAQTNNQRQDVSGLLVVGDEDFVQWLEGPEDAVKSVMDRISTDPRHTHVTLLETGPIHRRLFAGWSMLLADEMRQAQVQRSPMLSQSSNLIRELKQGGDVDAAFSGLAETTHGADAVYDPDSLEDGHAADFDGTLTAGPVEHFVRKHFVPAYRRKIARANHDTAPLLATALAHMALKRDTATIRSILTQSASAGATTITAQVSLIEQAERQLGDMWQADQCSETDILLGLVELIKALRAVRVRSPIKPIASDIPPSVLVISQPGELHMLPALLDAEVLAQQGWTPRLDFPQSDGALNALVEQDWYDAVDISLSNVFRRRTDLGHVAQTVSSIRAHSKNPKIAVTIGGRTFRGDVGRLLDTGADRLVLSANDIEWAISDALRARRSSRATAGPV